MELTRRRLVKGTVAGSVLLAGCNDGEDPGADPQDNTETATGGGANGSDATVQVGSVSDIGEVLVGPDGMTLYMFDKDSKGDGQSACMDDCQANWPALTVESDDVQAGENVTADISTFEREDGSMQVTANGWPLYHFAEDEEPGDANGQAVNDVWWVLGPDGSPIVSSGAGTETGTSEGY